jgi:hypothetical protein
MAIDWNREKQRLLVEYGTPMSIKNQTIELPLQTPLFEHEQFKATTHGVGIYYEALTKSIFGGTAHTTEQIKNNNELGGIIQGALETVPDLTDSNKRIYWESKGLSLVGGDLKLYDKQVRRYVMLQANMGRLSNPMIFYCVYCYNVGKKGYSIQKMSEGKLEKIIQLLSENTTMALFFSLSLVLHLHRKGSSRSVHRRRFEGEIEEYPMTRVRPNQLLRTMKEPLQELRKSRLRATDYEVHRARFPVGVNFNSHNITPFPVLIIKDANHQSWLARFNKLYNREAQEGREEIEDEAIKYGLFDPFEQYKKDEETETRVEETEQEKSGELLEGIDIEGDQIPF